MYVSLCSIVIPHVWWLFLRGIFLTCQGVGAPWVQGQWDHLCTPVPSSQYLLVKAGGPWAKVKSESSKTTWGPRGLSLLPVWKVQNLLLRQQEDSQYILYSAIDILLSTQGQKMGNGASTHWEGTAHKSCCNPVGTLKHTEMGSTLRSSEPWGLPQVKALGSEFWRNSS